MNKLSSKQVLQENNTTDPNTITALTLTHKALSDVSCLSDFKNLERLDLAFNNLSSLEVLKNCVNLKWLSVVRNKLQSLKGIEGLTKLTVLNAGKNKVRSMDEVRSLVSLRALILNDNEIASISRLDQMKELNTLVLSRNPIEEIGESLAKLKLISKLSLSNCKIHTIESSLKSCTELKELRLAHNDIKFLPGELARNVKIQNLDLGNNFIARWSDLKVLSSLVNLRNLNLQGNPIAEKEKLAKKIKKLVLTLQIYDGKPIDKTMRDEKGGRGDDSSLDFGNKLAVQKGEQIDQSRGNKRLENHAVGQNKDGDLDSDGDFDVEKKLKLKRKKSSIESLEKASEQKEKSTGIEIKKSKTMKRNGDGNPFLDPDLQDNLLRKKHKTKELPKEKAFDKKDFSKNSKNATIDDGETPFIDLFTVDTAENAINHLEKMENKPNQGANTVGGVVTFPKKKKKIKSPAVGSSALQSIIQAAEIGLGGSSAWDNE